MTNLVLALSVAPLVVGVVVMCIREPMRVALPIFAALIPFGGGLAIGTSRFGSLSSLSGLLLGLGLVLQLVTARRTAAVRLSPTVPVWLLFLSLAGASVLWSVNPDATVSDFVILASLILLYVFVSLSHVDRVVLRRTENGLLLGGVIVTCWGLAQLFLLGGFPDDTAAVGPAPDGRFGNDLVGPDNLPVALLLPLVVALSRAVTLTGRPQRFLHALIALLILGGILMTGSRGGILAALVAAVTLAFVIPRSARASLLAYGAVGLAVAALVWIYHPWGVAEREVETTSSSGRTDIWQVGLAACPRYCPVGSGWGTFPDVYADTQASVPGARVLVGEGAYEPHNLWLLAAIELGLLGLLLLAAALSLSILEAARLPVGLRAPPLSALAGAVFAAFFLSNLEFKFFWMALIAVALCRNLADSESSTPARRGELARFRPAG